MKYVWDPRKQYAPANDSPERSRKIWCKRLRQKRKKIK